MTHCVYADLMLRVIQRGQGAKWTAFVEEEVGRFKSGVVNAKGPHCDNVVLKLTIHLLDDLHDEATRFKSLGIIVASPFDHFNFHMYHSS